MTRILGRIDFTKLLHAQRFMGELYGAEVLTAGALLGARNNRSERGCRNLSQRLLEGCRRLEDEVLERNISAPRVKRTRGRTWSSVRLPEYAAV